MARKTYVKGSKIKPEIPNKSLAGNGLFNGRLNMFDLELNDENEVLESSVDYEYIIQDFEDCAKKAIGYSYPIMFHVWQVKTSDYLFALPLTFVSYYRLDASAIKSGSYARVDHDITLVFGQMNESFGTEYINAQIIIRFNATTKKWHFTFREL